MAEITMPKLSDTMTEGTLVAWKKKAGDKVSSGDVIAEIETDKATMEMESFEDGVLAEIYIQEGQKVAVGEKIARVQGKGEIAERTRAFRTEKPPTNNRCRQTKRLLPRWAPTSLRPLPAARKLHGGTLRPRPAVAEATCRPDQGLAAGPESRRRAERRSMLALTGTGPGGRIIQRDVLSAAPTSSGQTAIAPPIRRHLHP